MAAERAGMDEPELFLDAGYTKSTKFILDTSQVCEITKMQAIIGTMKVCVYFLFSFTAPIRSTGKFLCVQSTHLRWIRDKLQPTRGEVFAQRVFIQGLS